MWMDAQIKVLTHAHLQHSMSMFVDIHAPKQGSVAMNEIAQIRRKIPGEVFDYQVLLEALSGYSKPRDKITRLLAGDVIIRVKKGLYCFGDAFRREPVNREYLANLIYGPSYVSLDYALSYHGLIPERVETVTSATTRRSREFDTPFGTFTFRLLNERRYAIGAILETAGKATFLMATPEKALWQSLGRQIDAAAFVCPITMPTGR